MSDSKGFSALCNALRESTQSNCLVHRYLDPMEGFASSVAEADELPTLKGRGKHLLEQIAQTRAAIQEGNAALAALCMAEAKDTDNEISLELGRIVAASETGTLTVETVQQDGGVSDVFAAARMAKQTEQAIGQKAAELAAKKKSDDSRIAAGKRHERWRALRRRAQEIYESGQWKSRRAAAKSIAEKLIPEAEALGERPSRDQFPTTVDGWLKSYDEGEGLPADP